MPLIKQVTVSALDTMLNTDGNLMNAHAITITTVEGRDFIFSITTEDLMKLHFLIHKIV